MRTTRRTLKLFPIPSPTPSPVKAIQAVPSHSCGFCSTGHHRYCPGTILNASAKTPDKVWRCACWLQNSSPGVHTRAIERRPS